VNTSGIQYNRSTGVYIVGTDEALLSRINRMMKRKGIIGVTDTVGNVHYIVDARTGSKVNSPDMEQIVIPNGFNYASSFDEIINDVMKTHGFDVSLIGSAILIYLIRNQLNNEDIVQTGLKYAIVDAADVFGMSVNTVMRDIRYAVNKSYYADSGRRTSWIIHMMAEEVKETISFEKARNNK